MWRWDGDPGQLCKVCDGWKLAAVEKVSGAAGGAVGRDSPMVLHEPVFAGNGEEEIFGEVDFISVAELDGSFFNELPSLEGVHGVTGEVGRVVDLHLDAEVTRTEAGFGGSHIDNGERHDFVGGEIVGGWDGDRREEWLLDLLDFQLRSICWREKR